eukprot:15460599-Alexandrium_andersonii.AAC.1
MDEPPGCRPRDGGPVRPPHRLPVPDGKSPQTPPRKLSFGACCAALRAESDGGDEKRAPVAPSSKTFPHIS